MRRVAAGALVVFGTLGLPSAAHAHMMTTGLGPFYDGLAHLFVSPEVLLPVTALALLAGLRGAAAGRTVLLGLPAAWLAGGVVGALAVAPALPLGLAAVATIVLGALVAADAPIPCGALGAAAVGLGLVAGGGSAPLTGTAGAAGIFLSGGTAAVFVLVALLAGQAATVRVPAARIAVRVAGSWIAAIGLLMLGWAWRS